MKRQAQAPLLIAATLFLAGHLSAAEEPKTAAPVMVPAAPAAMMKPARADELLKRFDTNHDGKLDEDEVALAHEAMLKEQMDRQAKVAATPAGPQIRQRMLDRFDANHDGKLDDDERAEMRKFSEEHGLGPDGEVREELLKRFDKNADGKLDDAERGELEKSLKERRAQAGLLRTRLLRQFDHNHDGKIDDDERPELEKVMRERIGMNPPQLARYDKDGDGKLDDTEWNAARAEILAMVNNPPPGATMAADGALPPAEEQARLKRIAAEVAQRRAERLQKQDQQPRGETKQP
jgi:Ca2+-binding EF-hand superfamily protein